MAKRLVLCSCDQTRSMDANKIAQATGLGVQPFISRFAGQRSRESG